MRRAILALALVAGCQRPRALLMCHNSHCAGPTDPFADDTLQQLRASLRLRWNGGLLVDGTEIDSIWEPARGTCVFSHDETGALDGATDLEAAQTVVDEVLPVPSTRRFYVKIEAKPGVAPAGAPHTDDELVQHADCVLASYAVLRDAFEGARRPLTVYFESEDPVVVEAVLARSPQATPWVSWGTIIPFAALRSSRLDVDVVSLQWTQVGQISREEVAELEDRGIDTMLWMYDASPEALAAIEETRPRFVNTNEAVMMREWLGDPIDGD